MRKGLVAICAYNGVVAEWIAGAILSVWLMEMQYVKGLLQCRNVIVVAEWIAGAILSVWLMEMQYKEKDVQKACCNAEM